MTGDGRGLSPAEALVKGLRKAVKGDDTEWVDANIVRLLLDRYDNRDGAVDEALAAAASGRGLSPAEALVKGLRKAVKGDDTEWVDANIVRLLLDRYDNRDGAVDEALAAAASGRVLTPGEACCDDPPSAVDLLTMRPGATYVHKCGARFTGRVSSPLPMPCGCVLLAGTGGEYASRCDQHKDGRVQACERCGTPGDHRVHSGVRWQWRCPTDMESRPPESGRVRSLEQVVNDAISRSFGTYTVGPDNVERVIGLTTDDALADLRPLVEEQVRALYGTVFRG